MFIASYDGSTLYFDGLIDSVRIMNRALEPDEFLHYPLASWSLGALTEQDDTTPLDNDDDGIPDDGDGSLACWDNPCTGASDTACDDNCPFTENPDQADSDRDGLGDACDPDWVAIKAGTFWMGSPDGACPEGYPGECVEELGRQTNETLHEVTLTYDFEMMSHEVTQGEWETAFGNNPSYFGPNGNGVTCGADCPVERVNWYEAIAYANWLSEQAGLESCYILTECSHELGAGCFDPSNPSCTSSTYSCTVSLNSVSKPQDCEGYRLPTEAEWEYAIRTGCQYTAFYQSEGNNGVITNTDCTLDDNLNQIGWYCGNGNLTTHSVGGRDPNAWRVYDMSGNVWEWVWDWFGAYDESIFDPTGAIAGDYRICRGGNWGGYANYARSAHRGKCFDTERDSDLGFRLVRTLKTQVCENVTCGENAHCDNDTGACVCNYGSSGDPVAGCVENCEGVSCADNQYCDRGTGTCLCKRAFRGDPENCLTEDFVGIEAGTFWMGSPDGACPEGYPGECVEELGRISAREILHEVTLTYDFEMLSHEVTQKDWNLQTPWNPSTYSTCDGGDGNTCPVETVSWFDALAYANMLSEYSNLMTCYSISDVICEDESSLGDDYIGCMNAIQGGIDSATVTLAGGVTEPQDCEGYRLPTEAEWEYSIRSGYQYTAFYQSNGNDGTITNTGTDPIDPNLTQIAWYGGNNTPYGTKPIGGKEATPWGLVDMGGNVWEWTWDHFCTNNTGYGDDPDASTCAGTQRVARGGSWGHPSKYCRSADRNTTPPSGRSGFFGFRLVRTLHGE